LAGRSKMPRGRPDPFSQVADGGCFHLVPGLQILEQDRAQLDEAQRGLASGDDGVHAGAVTIVRAHPAVAVAIEGCRVTARSAVTLTGDEIDERCFLSLLHKLPFSMAGQGADRTGADRVAGLGGTRFRRVLEQYTGPNPMRQEGNQFFLGIVRLRERSGRAADEEVLGQRTQLMEGRVDLTGRIALERARGRGRAPGRDPVIGGHP
jgi:hypothetical protein